MYFVVITYSLYIVICHIIFLCFEFKIMCRLSSLLGQLYLYGKKKGQLWRGENFILVILSE